MSTCSTLKIAFFAAWILWAIWITIFMRRIYYTNLKDLVNPDVKFFSNQIVGRRYDCVNINLLKFTLVGIFLLPFRLAIVVLSILIEYVWCRILGIMYGSKFSTLLKSDNPSQLERGPESDWPKLHLLYFSDLQNRRKHNVRCDWIQTEALPP
jgi:hypothetical protein